MKSFIAAYIPEPLTYTRNNRACYYDFVSKQLRIKTPEETVRQKLLRFLVDELHVPMSAIQVEVPMAHFLKGTRDRADIIIYGLADDNIAESVAVIECKAPHIVLVDDVFLQVDRYAQILKAPIAGVTNGESFVLDYWQEAGNRYERIMNIPIYEEMCRPENLQTIDIGERFPSYTFQEIISDAIYREELSYGNIGATTPKSLVPFIINPINGLLYDSSECEGLCVLGHRFVKDLGIRFTSFNNASGGIGWTGDYRAFMLEDTIGNTVIVSLSVMGTITYTALIVAIDDFEKHHNSLQLNIDKHARFEAGQVSVKHDEKISIGNIGSAKSSEIISFTAEHNPAIVSNNQIQLGSFQVDRLLDINAADFRSFLSNVISYALIRDEFRNAFKQKGKL
ncbi:MAG: type I restriction enzyme HsdR N-terminal domain-containing protein [Clostridiales bacterium]|nr:type I restriction enzyme HsdR N-terminal domain-containing protein [Clostridiales bacterium]